MDRMDVMMAAMDAETEEEFLRSALEIPRRDLWLLTDLALLHEQLFDGRPEALAERLEVSDKTVLSWLHTGRTFPPEERTWGLSYSIYRIAAYSKDPKGWLERTRAEQLTAEELRALIRDVEGRSAPRGKRA